MRDLVVNPTAFSHLSARVEESANVGLPACNYGGGRGVFFWSLWRLERSCFGNELPQPGRR